MIRLNKIFVNKSSCHYEFDISSDLASFFTGKNFTIEYDEDISLVPKSILAVPFVCNVLPLIWLSGSTLYIEELDKDFFESINEFKKGYIEMFPKASFRGGGNSQKYNQEWNFLSKQHCYVLFRWTGFNLLFNKTL